MMDENILTAIHQYCESVSEDQGSVLYNLYRETHIKTMAPRMASGPVQGRFLSFLSKLIKPNHILEIGTFTGYATICLSEGLAQDGKITTIEVNPELNHLSDKYFKLAGIREKVTSLIGDAREIIPSLDGPFDMVFIDARKKDYALYFDMVIDKVKPHGILLADNVLWDGKVIENAQDATSQALRNFNQKIKEDVRIESLLLPLRDGLMIMKKK